MKTADRTELFERKPIRSAVLSLAIPTIISQLITVIYNLVDTFFVGQLGDPAQVAAVVVSMPAFILLTGIANLFGIGGASLTSRALGAQDEQKAKYVTSFCIWGALITGAIYGLLFTLFKPALLPFLGAKADTFDFAYQYIFWTTTIGGIPTIMNALLAHLVRTEGASKQAGFGVALGGLLNVALDPLLMFGFGLGLNGAAIATMLSNCIAVFYFLAVIYRRRSTTVVSFRPYAASLHDHIPREVVLVGMPGFVMTLMSVVSNVTLTRLISSYSTTAVAGMGIAKKIDTMAFSISQGLAQGVLPLLGYNYAAGNGKRINEAIRFTLIFGLILTLSMMFGLYLFAPQITNCFINDGETVRYGSSFLRIICFVCPTTCVNFLVITIFQAIGRKVQPLVLSMMRKGIIDLPLMFLFNGISGLIGIAWAIPIADWICFVVSIFMVVPYLKYFRTVSQPAPAVTAGLE
ncbi:MAG: MATE family efflux transporter [Candidatus Limiplasma sp.]|nr:MATE family efflux transporter [Candidatus Limiplasma sp.]